jgi:capsule polysaccharide export protein KpsE/RkpR
MKRALLVLLLGLSCGTAAHFGYYYSRRPCSSGSLDCELVWIKDELNLSDTQFAQIKRLHENSGPQLVTLAAEVARLQRELAVFENQRRTTDQIDFIEFAKFAEERRAMDRQCIDSTRLLVESSAKIMTPVQRKRYLALVAMAEPPPWQQTPP